MLHQLKELPDHMCAFSSTEPVKREEVYEILIPSLQKMLDKHGKVRVLLLFHTAVKDMSPNGWFGQLAKAMVDFHPDLKIALVTDQQDGKALYRFMDSRLPEHSELKLFDFEDLGNAIFWLDSKTKLFNPIFYTLLTGLSVYLISRFIRYKRQLSIST